MIVVFRGEGGWGCGKGGVAVVKEVGDYVLGFGAEGEGM